MFPDKITQLSYAVSYTACDTILWVHYSIMASMVSAAFLGGGAGTSSSTILFTLRAISLSFLARLPVREGPDTALTAALCFCV